MSILTPIEDKEHNVDFLSILENPLYEPAKDIISLIFETYVDKDGNFIEQFQTTAFSPRLWELFLHQVLISEGFTEKTEHAMPDFNVVKNGIEFFIEATTSNPNNADNPSEKLLAVINSEAPIAERRASFDKLKAYYIEKIGGPLYTKLSENKYYELAHVVGKPLIFALAPLHDDFAKRNSDSLIIEYLYGIKLNSTIDAEGNLVSVNYQTQTEFEKINGATIEPFFLSENSEHVSAVIFFNDITLDQFNRMGYLSSDYDNLLIARNCDIYATEGPLSNSLYFVLGEDSPHEDWKQGISVFHNPNALVPVDREAFAGFRQVWLDAGKTDGFMPDFFPFYSLTMVDSL